MDRKEYLSFISQQYFDVCKSLKDYCFPQLIQYGRKFFLSGSKYPTKDMMLWSIAKLEANGNILLASEFGAELSTNKGFVGEYCHFAPDVELLLMILPARVVISKRKFKNDDGLFCGIEFYCKKGENETTGLTLSIALAKLWLKLNAINAD